MTVPQRIRGRCELFGFYNPHTGTTRARFAPHRQAPAFVEAVRSINHACGTKRVILLLDNLPMHRSWYVKTHMHPMNVQLVWLPTHSPRDNPIELVFDGLDSAVIANSRCRSVRQLQQRIQGYLRQRNAKKDRFINIEHLLKYKNVK